MFATTLLYKQGQSQKSIRGILIAGNPKLASNRIKARPFLFHGLQTFLGCIQLRDSE